MWSSTRDLIENSLSNFNQIFRRDRSSNSSSIDLDFRRRTLRSSRTRRSNARTNCLSRNSTRASTLNSQLNRELLLNTSQNSIIRPPHARSSCHSSNLSSPSSQHNSFAPLPSVNHHSLNQSLNQSQSLNNQSPSLNNQNLIPNRPLSPLLPPLNTPLNTRYPILSCSPYSPPYSNVFSQHYLRSISRSLYNLAGEQGNLLQLTKEKNYLSCLINLLVIITIVIAIIQPKWFAINGGLCNNKYIGLQEFMFLQNSATSTKNPFSFSNLNGEHKAYSPPPTQAEKPKINYFRLTDEDNLVRTIAKINLTEPLNLNKTDLNSPKNHTQPLQNILSSTLSLTTTQTSPIIHLPILPSSSAQLEKSIEKSKNHLLFRNHEKIKKHTNDETNIIQLYKNLADHYQNHVNECLSPDVLSLQRLIIILCVFVIFSSLIQLLLDLIGSTKNKYVNLLREHAIFNIISVIIILIIICISYLLSNLLTKEQIHKHTTLNNQYYHQFYHSPDHYYTNNKPISLIDHFNLNKDENRIEVKLEISYYLVIFAGVFSVVASLVNLFNKPNLYLININSDQETSNLLNDDTQFNGYWPHLFNLNNNPNLVNYYHYLSPPPPYSPPSPTSTTTTLSPAVVDELSYTT